MKTKIKMHAMLAPSENLRAMLSALRAVPTMAISENDSAGTITVTHSSGVTVLSAIQKSGAGSPWIVRHAANLFA
jgi:hypothetical protein